MFLIASMHRITFTLKKVICHHNIRQILVITVIYLRRFHKTNHDIVLVMEAVLLNHFTNGRNPCLQKRTIANTESYQGAILMTTCNTRGHNSQLFQPLLQCPDQVKTETMQLLQEWQLQVTTVTSYGWQHVTTITYYAFHILL